MCIPGAHKVAAAPTPNAICKVEFVADHPSFPTSHASTLVETRGGLIAAWFGGSQERAIDVGIWLSRNSGGGWSEPREIANGIQEKAVIRYPCWNPVLFKGHAGPLLLFYKVGPSPEAWWGMLTISTNEGSTWSAPARLPEGIFGPIRNKPVELPDRSLLCGSSTENAGWHIHMERTIDFGRT